MNAFCFPVLYNGITLANLILLGKVPDRKDWLQIYVKGVTIS